MKTKKITFTAFKIEYDGIYHLIVEKKRFKIYLRTPMFLTLMEQEGYTIEDFKKLDKNWQPIPFSKTSISIFECFTNGKSNGYLTSEGAADLQENNLFLLEVEID